MQVVPGMTTSETQTLFEMSFGWNIVVDRKVRVGMRCTNFGTLSRLWRLGAVTNIAPVDGKRSYCISRKGKQMLIEAGLRNEA